METRVSIIIPFYNAKKYINRTLQSVLAEITEADEVICIDDGSEDKTFYTIRPFLSRFKYFRQNHSGVSIARNKGLEQAQGKYLLFLDSDDVLIRGKLDKQVQQLERSKSIGLSHSGWTKVDEHENPLTEIRPWEYAPTLDLGTWIQWKPVFLGAMLIRKEWVEITQGFDPSLKHAEDVDLVFRMVLEGCQASWLKESTILYRQHRNNASRNKVEQVKGSMHVLNKIFLNPKLPVNFINEEKRIKYFTLLWHIKQLCSDNLHSKITKYVSMAIQYRNYPPIMAFLELCEKLDLQNAPAEVIRAAARGVGETREISQAARWWVECWHGNLPAEKLISELEMETQNILDWSAQTVLVSPSTPSWEHVEKYLDLNNKDGTAFTVMYLILAIRYFRDGAWKPLLLCLAKVFQTKWYRRRSRQSFFELLKQYGEASQ